MNYMSEILKRYCIIPFCLLVKDEEHMQIVLASLKLLKRWHDRTKINDNKTSNQNFLKKLNVLPMIKKMGWFYHKEHDITRIFLFQDIVWDFISGQMKH